MYKLLIYFVILLASLKAFGQNKPLKFEELKTLQIKEAKPVVILIRTDWCKYCHSMQNTMQNNQKVSQLLSNKFYTIFLDAEDKKDIFFAGRKFKYRHGVNELATELASVRGKVSYPTLSILNSKNEIVYQHNGLLSAKGMLYVLTKVAEISK